MISKMTLNEQLKYLNDMEKGYEGDNSTIDEIEEKFHNQISLLKKIKLNIQ